MYKVLIVDDEKMIRMGMKKVLPWQKLKIEEVYTAASGKEALGILEEYHPQIMISDIQMTEMTGLELIEKAKEKVPDLRVIVLTGYDNFEYARQSLRLEVQDFFLKPIDEAVKKQVDYLDEQKQAEKTQPEQVRTQGFEQQNRLEHYLRSLVHQREEKETILNALKEHYHFDFNQSMKVILIVPTLYMNRKVRKKIFVPCR
jgi:two-component system response regulator YesN